MSSEISRRSFLQHLIIGSAGIYFYPVLQSCKDKNPYSPLKEASGMRPFNVWQEMVYALERSPDHLVARRNALVKAGDPEPMADFVKNNFRTICSDDQYFRRSGYQMKYGPKAALRCGLATPRGKAEILKEMLLEAGYEARIVHEYISFSKEEVMEIVFQANQPEFAPPVNQSKMREWKKELGVRSVNGQVKTLQEEVKRAQQLGKGLVGKIEREEKGPRKFSFDKNVSTVAFKENGEDKYIHVFDPEVPFGSLHPKNERENPKNSDNYDLEGENLEITVSLTCTNAFSGEKETELVKGSWNASRLVGNQIKVNFLKNMTLEEQSSKNISQISNFTPALSLQDIDEEKEYMEKYSFLGEVIDLEGEKITENVMIREKRVKNKKMDSVVVDSEDSAGIHSQLVDTLNERRIDSVQQDSLSAQTAISPTTAISDVASLEVQASPKAFPKVKVEVYPRDKEGRVVEGLEPTDFSFSDNNQPVIGWMKQNMVAPKIMLLYDTSLSMPAEYSNEGIKKFLQSTQQSIRELYPHAKIQLKATGSRIYTSHLKAAQSDNDLILYATDGDNKDSFNKEYADVYKEGPPTLYLNVRDKTRYFNDIIENTQSDSVFASDPEKTVQSIQKYLSQLEFPPYVFTYSSFDVKKDHTLTVNITDNKQAAESSFRFPAGSENAVGNRMIGLYLNVKVGNKEYKRVLAGWDYETEPKADPTKQMANEVHEMLLGGAVIAVERECPTLSVRLSEFLRCQLSNQPWYEAFKKNNHQQAIEEIKKGVLDYPPQFISMMQPLANNISEDSITFPQGYRMGVLSVKPGYYQEKSRVGFDYLSSSGYESFTRSGTNSFLETAQKTAQFAILEDSVFQKSALSELQDSRLVLNRTVRGKERYSRDALGSDYNYFHDQLLRGYGYRLFDEKAEKRSFFYIHPETGELLGVLPNQTGGGSNSVQQQLRELDKVVKEYQKLVAKMNLGMMVTGVGNIPLGIVASYGVTLVKLYAIASEAIIIMDSGKMDEQIKQALQQLACNVYKEITYAGLGPVGEGMSGIENLIAAMGGSYSFVECP